MLLAQPGTGDLGFGDRWIALIGFLVVLGVGLAYLLIAKPDERSRSEAPEGDAMEVAALMRQIQAGDAPGDADSAPRAAPT